MFNKAHLFITLTLTFSFTLIGCNSEEETKPQPKTEQSSSNVSHHHVAGHGGAVIQLGTSNIGSFNVTATRDEGPIIAGKDAPIDVTVVPSTDETAIAVRFWIGTEDGVGSIKAKAGIENPAEPNRLHTHAIVPNPIPTGCQLWVEIETNNRDKVTGAFDLNSE